MMLPSLAWIAVAVIVGYIIGSISFAVLVARSRGVDIFAVGSGNPGATNVKRTLGAGPGNWVFALDACKGVVTAGWPLLLGLDAAIPLGLWGLGGAILGHSFSVFLGFRGGKGVATTMGGILVLMPSVLLIGLVVWLLLFYASRVVAVASIGFGIALPIAAMMTAQPLSLRLFAAALALLLVLRHRSNIFRLFRGEEHGFGRKNINKKNSDKLKSEDFKT
jgi:glycerol-3-phosphate acyltransferase PlsY